MYDEVMYIFEYLQLVCEYGHGTAWKENEREGEREREGGGCGFSLMISAAHSWCREMWLDLVSS